MKNLFTKEDIERITKKLKSKGLNNDYCLALLPYDINSNDKHLLKNAGIDFIFRERARRGWGTLDVFIKSEVLEKYFKEIGVTKNKLSKLINIPTTVFYSCFHDCPVGPKDVGKFLTYFKCSFDDLFVVKPKYRWL